MGLLFMVSAASAGGTGGQGKATGNATQPACDAILTADRRGLARQDQEGSLADVLRLMGIAQDAAAHAQDHWPMALHQVGKGVRIVLADEKIEQLAIGSGRGLVAADHPADAAHELEKLSIGHEGRPLVCFQPIRGGQAGGAEHYFPKLSRQAILAIVAYNNEGRGKQEATGTFHEHTVVVPWDAARRG